MTHNRIPCASKQTVLPSKRRGFAIAPILYLLMMIGVAAGLLFSSFSQVLHTNINTTNVLTVKNDINAIATALSASSGVSQGLVCTPPSSADAVTGPCAGTTVRNLLVPIASADTVHLPKNAATAALAGTGGHPPAEYGVLSADAGVKQLDPWGHYYIYCRWNTSTEDNLSAQVMKIISAGPSGTLQSTCDDPGNNANPVGDNQVVSLTPSMIKDRASVWINQGQNATYGTTNAQVMVTSTGGMEALSATVTGLVAQTASITTLQGQKGHFDDLSLTHALPIAYGGTGQTTASTARTALGSGYIGDSLFLTQTATDARHILEAGTIGHSLFMSETASGARNVLGSGTVGDAVFLATTATAARNALGGNAVGQSLFVSTSQSEARGVLGSGTTGDLLFQAPDAHTGRANLGAGTVGEGTFQAATYAQAWAALGLTGGSGTLNVNVSGQAGTVPATGIVGIVSISQGGTGASDAATARSNLGANNAGNLTTGVLPLARIADNSIPSTKLTTTGVTAQTYNWGTVDAAGRVTAANDVVLGNLTDGSGDGVSASTSGGGSLTFMTASTVWMTLDSNGYLGLNITNPGERLHVNVGNIRVSGPAATARDLQFTTSTSSLRWVVGTDSSVESGSNAGSNFFINRYSDAGAALGTALSIVRSTGAASFSGTVASTGGFSGNLTGNVTGQISLPDGTVGSPSMNFQNNANMGIYRPGASAMAFVTGGAERLRLSATSGIGIGTTAPRVALDIGSLTDAMVLPVGTTAQRPGSNYVGAVRYNTTVPGLEINNGSAWSTLLSSTSTISSGVVLGASAAATNPQRSGDVTTGLFSGTAATVSVAISGTETVRVSATGLDLSDIADGFSIANNEVISLPASDTSSLALGPTALSAQNSTGVSNVAVGSAAGKSVTSGHENVAVGVQALYTTTTGYQNVAIGTHALYTDSSGSQNMAMGYEAMYSNTTGSDNVANGAQTLYSNKGGNNNAAIGYEAMFYNVSGGENTAIGFMSFASNTTGNNNTALGAYALYNSATRTTGNNNTAIGYQVGSKTLISGSGNILIGTSSLTDVPTATTNNWMNIGNTLYADLSAGNVGVGSATIHAGASLDLGSRVDSLLLPGGTTAQRPGTGVTGMLRYNSTIGQLEAYTASGWSMILANSATSSPDIYLGSSATTTNPHRNGDVTTGLFSATASTLSVSTAGVERLRVTATGSVGVGTVTPSAVFSAVSTGTGTDVASFTMPNSSTAGVNIAGANGFVKTIPNAAAGSYNPLTLGGDSAMIFSGTAIETGALVIAPWSITGNGLRITSTGGVGLNTAAPGQPLEINANSGSAAIRLRDSNGAFQYWDLMAPNGQVAFTIKEAGTDRFFIKTGGNVGIGTTSPSYLLDVNGVMRATGILGTTATITNIVATTATTTNLIATSATIGTLNTTNVVATTATIGTQNITTLNATNLVVTTGTITNLVSTTATIGTVRGTDLYSTGRVYLADGTAAAPSLTFINDTNLGIYRPVADVMAFSTSGTEAMRITATNSVGIGTAAPAATLAVAGSGTGFAAIGGSFCGGNYAGIGLNSYTPDCFNYNILSSSTDKELYLNRPTGNGIRFRMNNADQMILTSTGSVGIGTTAPNSMLDVESTATTTTTPLMLLAPSLSAGSGTYLKLGRDLSNYDQADIRFGYVGANSMANYLAFGFYGTGNYLTVTASGFVGVGTSSPAAMLNVDNGANYGVLMLGSNGGTKNHHLVQDTNGSLTYYTGTFGSGSAQMVLTATGSVGVGTTTPLAGIEVSGSFLAGTVKAGNAELGGYLSYNMYNNGTGWKYRSAGNAFFVRNDGSTLGFYGAPSGAADGTVSAAEALAITGTGSVGVGTATPAYALDVSGGIRASSEIISTSANQFRMAYGNYGAFWRNDGSNTYFLLTASGDAYGTWNTLRPIYISDSTGAIYSNTMLSIGTALHTGASLDVSGKTDSIMPAAGTTAQRPTGVAGMMRYNTSIGQLEAYTASGWVTILANTATSSPDVYLGSSASITNPHVNGDATTGLFTPAAGTVAVSTSGTEAMRITATNSVGIGTTAPGYQLDVSNSFRVGNANTGGDVVMGYDANGAIEIGLAGRASAGSPYLDFHSSAGSPDFDARIQVTGGDSTAGDGTMSLFAKHFVLGDGANIAAGNYGIAVGTGNQASGTNAVAVGASNTASGMRGIAIGNNNKAFNIDSLAMGVYNTSSGTGSMAIGSWNTVTGDQGVALGSFNTSSGIISTTMGYNSLASGYDAFAMGYFNNATAPYAYALGRNMSATATGAFGINLSMSPSQTLSQANTMAIMGGNVGVGTVTPAATLNIVTANSCCGPVGSSNTSALAIDGAVNDLGVRLYNTATGGRDWRVLSSAAGTGVGVGNFNIWDNTAQTSRLAITATGSVGIGTTSPNAYLDIGTFYSCCASAQTPTLGISEASSSNSRMPWIQFHAAGKSEAFFRLQTADRNFEIGDSQAVGAGLAIMKPDLSTRNVYFSPSGSSYINSGNLGIGTSAPAALLSIANGANDPINYGHGIQITSASGSHQQMSFIRSGYNVMSLGYYGATNIWGLGIGAATDANWTPNLLSFDLSQKYLAVGTATPIAPLTVQTGQSSTGTFGAGTANNGILVIRPYNTGNNWVESMFGLTLATGGNGGTSKFGSYFSILGVDVNYNAATDSLETGMTMPMDELDAMAITMSNYSTRSDGNPGRMSFWTSYNASPVERLSITNVGKIGIGTANPTHRLNVYNPAGSVRTGYHQGNGGSGDVYITDNNAILSSNVYYNGAWYNTAAGTGTIIDFTGGIFDIQTTATAAAGAAATGTLRLYMTNAGFLGLNAGVPTYPIQVGTTTSNGNGAFLDPAGVWTNASDARSKENVHEVPYGLETIMKLKPVAYEMKGTHQKQIGFIAQEVAKVVPEVTSVSDKGWYGLSYGNMNAITVKAIQELKAENDKLAAEVARLQVQGEDVRAGRDGGRTDALTAEVADLHRTVTLLIWGLGELAIIALGGVGAAIFFAARRRRR